MSAWFFDLSAAPRDKKLWLASKCGKVSATYWDKKREAWSGFKADEQPIAWQDYVVPEHPFQSQANVGEEFVAKDAASSDDPASRTDDVRERQHASTVGFADDCRQGGNEQAAAASVPALITHKHIFLDDCGSGA